HTPSGRGTRRRRARPARRGGAAPQSTSIQHRVSSIEHSAPDIPRGPTPKAAGLPAASPLLDAAIPRTHLRVEAGAILFGDRLRAAPADLRHILGAVLLDPRAPAAAGDLRQMRAARLSAVDGGIIRALVRPGGVLQGQASRRVSFVRSSTRD